jgi:hypothetical protein
MGFRSTPYVGSSEHQLIDLATQVASGDLSLLPRALALLPLVDRSVGQALESPLRHVAINADLFDEMPGVREQFLGHLAAAISELARCQSAP